MSSQRHHERVAAIFARARRLDGERRDLFLDDACLGDPETRAEVEELLAEHEAHAEFLEADAPGDALRRRALTDAGGDSETATEAPGDLPRALAGLHLLRRIGRGGMGTVYEAELTVRTPYGQAGTRVAVKVMHRDLLSARTGFKRLLREAELGMRVEHPAVVRTYDIDAAADVDGPCHYLVMEYVEGRTLRDLLRDQGTIAEAVLRHIALQIAAGLDAIHTAGAVHRDIKPQNVLITPDHEVKVMDLGIARLVDESLLLTQSGQFVGTPAYAAPEQFSGAAIGPPADLYALGALLYEAATGIQPFAADTAPELIRRHTDLVPPRPSSHMERLSPFFDELVGCLLAKNPAQRFRSAAELTDVLEQGERSTWWLGRARAGAAEPARRPIRLQRDARFVGREEELASMTDAYRAARGGVAQVVLLEGEAGIGKSRLVDELLGRLDELGERPQILYAPHQPGVTHRGLAPIERALATSLGTADLEDRLGALLPAMPRLVPALACHLRGDPPPPEIEPLSEDSLHTGICELTRGLAGSGPLIWIVEDLHLSSSDCRSLLLALAQAVADLPVLMLLTTRPGEPSEAMAQLQTLPSSRRLVLGRLSPREVVELLREVLRSDVVAERLGGKVAYKSDGNAFFVFEILRSLKESGALTQQSDGSYSAASEITAVSVPSSVRELLLTRLRDLDDDERALLDVASVQGFAFDPELVALVLDQRRLQVLQALTAIERRSGLVRATGAGFEFDHHHLQEIVYDSVGPMLRREYHALLAQARRGRDRLEDRPADSIPGETAVFLAEHYLKGGLADDALQLLPRAIEQLTASFDHEAVIEMADLAATMLADGTAVERCRLRLRQAQAHDALGDRSRQREALDDALAAARQAGDAALEASSLVELGRLAFAVSDYERAESVLADAVERAQVAGERDSEARATINLGNVMHTLGRLDDARQQFEASQSLARASRLPHREAEAIGNLGALHLEQGGNEEALSCFEKCLELRRELGDRAGEVRTLNNMALALRYLGRYDEALATHERQMALCGDMGNLRSQAIATGNVGGLLYHLGELARAYDHFRRHGELAALVGYGLGEAKALANLGLCALDSGRLDDAESHLASCLDRARKLGARPLESEATLALAEVASIRARDDEARSGFESALSQRRKLGARDALASALLGYGRHLLGRAAADAARPMLLEARSIVDGLPSAEVGALPASYLALVGAIDPASVTVDARSPVHVRAEVHAVLHRAGADRSHRDEARALIAHLRSHLAPTDVAGFERHNRAARLLSDVA